LLQQGPFAPIGARQASGGGAVLGSVGCFLVIESRVHAAKRGVDAFAHIASIRTDRCRRLPGEATKNAKAQFAALSPHFDPGGAAVLSGATGIAAATREEQAFLAEIGLPVRATGTALGHSVEPSFPANLALAALAVRHGSLFPPLEAAEQVMTTRLTQALVTSWGLWRGEALALVAAA
jgi:3-oxoacyl-[acyl-carrier-protein] synthase II